MNTEENKESWVVSEGESTEGVPNVIRLREDLPSDADKARLKILIIITWKYDLNESGAMPSDEEIEKMELFEDLMDEGVVETGFGRLVTVFTGDGMREWQFYTHSEDAFMEKLNQTLVGEEVFPLEIDVFDDENWDGYNDYRKLIFT